MGRLPQFLLGLLTGLLFSGVANAQRFFPDDPIQVAPPPLSVKKALNRDINYLYDFLDNSRKMTPPPAVPAGAINTLGEVPDNAWFTNRHARRRLTRAELQRGPTNEAPPKPPFTVTGGKGSGVTPGFKMKDAADREYFVKFDPPSNPEMTTAADVVTSRFLYAIGYNTPQNDIVVLRPSDLLLSPKAKLDLPDGRERQMTRHDLDDLFDKVPHNENGTVRLMASLDVKGDPIGPFRPAGTRQDDPNDIVPHENRRDLRGLSVFYSWLNNTDAKSTNSLDVIVQENGTSFIRHYLIDFGSSLGSDADRPKDARFGHEFILPKGRDALKSIGSLGLRVHPWEKADMPDLAAAGNFEAETFEPDKWKSNYPIPAFMSRLPDDEFWAAKQVMTFSNDDIRAIVETARYSDPRVTDYVVETLIKRRDKIGQTFFSKVLPLDGFRMDGDELRFEDLSVKYGFRSQRKFYVRWFRFDNVTQKQDPIPSLRGERAAAGSYFSAIIEAEGEFAKSITVYMRKDEAGYRIVGIDRRW